MSEVIPGILEKNWQEIEKKLEIIKPFSRKIHIDFLDGKFSEETSFLTPGLLKNIKTIFLWKRI